MNYLTDVIYDFLSGGGGGWFLGQGPLYVPCWGKFVSTRDPDTIFPSTVISQILLGAGHVYPLGPCVLSVSVSLHCDIKMPYIAFFQM